MISYVKRCWDRFNLAQQFAVVSFLVLVTGMLGIGWWVAEQIESGVTQNSAVTTALFMNSFVAPETQELATQTYLTSESMATLDRLHRETPLGERVLSLKIWGPGGLVVYSSRPSIIGKVFPLTPNLALAWQGEVTVELSDLDDEEDALERRLNIPLLEIYSPIREKWSERIIGVAEFYQSAEELEALLLKARVDSWVVVAATTLVMFVLLFRIVRGGSRTISSQQIELQRRVRELSNLLIQNEELNARARNATNRAIELNERFLRRVSAELHDGPAQAIGFALLRLDSVMERVKKVDSETPKDTKARGDLNTIRNSLGDALQEIRNLSGGLALPELDELTVQQSLQRVARAHQRRTNTNVELSIDEIPDNLPLPLKIGAYRFVQEALNNAFHHGGGKQQRVHAGCANTGLEIEVTDHGPGFDPPKRSHNGEHLGLAGMRERIESLGGRFELHSAPGKGTRVVARLPIRLEEEVSV